MQWRTGVPFQISTRRGLPQSRVEGLEPNPPCASRSEVPLTIGDRPETKNRPHLPLHLRLFCREWAVAVLVVTVLLGMTFSGNLLTIASPTFQHLGVEYYNIARALSDGRGFSDPFAESSSSTAWMPPLYPMLLAALLVMLKKKSLVAIAVVGLQVLGLSAIGLWCHRIARGLARRIRPIILIPIFLTWIAAFAFWFLMCTHDIWLAALIVMAIVAAVHEYQGTRSPRPGKWGLLGGLAATTSPAVAGAWFVLTILELVRAKHRLRHAAISLVVAGSLCMPWVVRNAITFHQFIPVKSNLFFDAYQANCSDADGIIDLETTTNHPHESLDTRFVFSQLGESKFMSLHRDRFFACVRRSPSEYLARIGNRALTMTVRYIPFFEESWYGLGLRRLLYAMPLVGFLLTWRGPNRNFVRALMVLHGAYLCPYLFVTFHIRYFLPLTPVCVLVLFNMVEGVASRLDLQRSRAGLDALVDESERQPVST